MAELEGLGGGGAGGLVFGGVLFGLLALSAVEILLIAFAPFVFEIDMRAVYCDFVPRYFINYFTRHTSMEDPRSQRQPESIPLQDFSNTRLGLMMGTNSLKRQQSLTDGQTTTTEQSVAKISAMFPTVSETHIRTLLLKYHNREAVVMSALQVEKHPLTMPGPYTPPLGARPLPGRGLYAVTPPHSPRASPLPMRLASAPTRPHSPKMKLRYLKSVFPVVEETMLLDTLSSSDNNVHRATQALMTMGFDKRATPPPRVCLQRERNSFQPPAPTVPPSPSPRMKSVEEKEDMKVRLRSKHPDIPERVISIALDSVDFDEARADQILGMMADDQPHTSSSDVGQEESNEIIIEEPSQAASPESAPPSPQDNQTIRSENDTDCPKTTRKSAAVGPDPSIRRGPNQALLLPDYEMWVGRDAGLARGPNPALRGHPAHAPVRGPDPALRKGPNRSLTKGSIYSRLAGLSLESRGN